LILVENGTYRGFFKLTKAGTAQHPIVLKAKNHAKIEGAVSIVGAHNWVWGFEITDPTGSVKATDACLRLASTGARGINNVVHHPTNKNSAAAWEKGPGQVLYGNIIHDGRHNLYTQNDYNRFGYKYIVGNVLLDSAPDPDGNNTFNFHAYTERSHISGFHIEKNVFAGGRWLLGGYGDPHHHEIIRSNYFHGFGVDLGYRRPMEVEFTNNYLGHSTLNFRSLWGAGETSFTQPGITTVKGNHIIPAPGALHIYLITSAYVNNQLLDEGQPKLRQEDVWNGNFYYDKFRADLVVNRQLYIISGISDWRNKTRTSGNAFDVQSKALPKPRGVRTFLIQNEYDRNRAFLVVYNWSGAQQVNYRLPRAGAVYDIKRSFEAPLATGITGRLQMNRNTFGVFLVRFSS
jgi:hypothetical protein